GLPGATDNRSPSIVSKNGMANWRPLRQSCLALGLMARDQSASARRLLRTTASTVLMTLVKSSAPRLKIIGTSSAPKLVMAIPPDCANTATTRSEYLAAMNTDQWAPPECPHNTHGTVSSSGC